MRASRRPRSCQPLGEFERSQAELTRLPPEDRDRPAALAVACANLPRAGRGPRPTPRPRAPRALATSPRKTCGRSCRCSPPHGRDDLVVRMVETLRQKGLAASADLEALGAAYARQGQLALAREALEAATVSRPDDAALLLALARVAYDQKDLEGRARLPRPRAGGQPPGRARPLLLRHGLRGRSTSAARRTRRSPRPSASIPTTPRRTTRSAPWPCTARTRRRRSPTSGVTPS